MLFRSVESIENLSERCVTDDVFTSIHIEEYEVMARDTKLGEEDEKSELLHMMYTQKKLFERVDRSKFSLKKINIFKNNKVLSISLSILLASYLVN